MLELRIVKNGKGKVAGEKLKLQNLVDVKMQGNFVMAIFPDNSVVGFRDTDIAEFNIIVSPDELPAAQEATSNAQVEGANIILP